MTNAYLAPAELPAPVAGTTGPAYLLVCPECGDRNLTTGSPSDDGHTYAVPMEGDCGHRWTLLLRTEKGQTFLLAGQQA